MHACSLMSLRTRPGTNLINDDGPYRHSVCGIYSRHTMFIYGAVYTHILRTVQTSLTTFGVSSSYLHIHGKVFSSSLPLGYAILLRWF